METLAKLSVVERAALAYDWRFWARDKQIPPETSWRTWLLLAGRGFGKSRTGAEWVRSLAESGRCSRIALVGPTASAVRDVMVTGKSGLIGVCPPWNRPKYESSKHLLTWPNGVVATTYSAEEPDRLRGPEHDAAWADEIASWRYPESWDMLMFGLRIGSDPRCVVTTTPRPVRLVRELLAAETTVVTRGSTYENRENLARAFFDDIVRKYEGSRLGRQELLAELLDDNPNALWRRSDLDRLRVSNAPENLKRIVVAVDPAISSGEDSDETGIVVAAVGLDGHGYVLEDASMRGTPAQWAAVAADAYHRWKADRLVAETNQGGEMVEHTIRMTDRNISYRGVRASRGKIIRAEPISALYEQGRCHHVGSFAKLEDQMTEWTPGDDSPDRLDALVWAFTDLMVSKGGAKNYPGIY
jgi:phage terminase large subunit-like protein